MPKKTSKKVQHQYAGLFTQMMLEDADRDLLLEKIDNAIACQYDVPAELKALPWIGERKLAQTHLADALNAAARPFAAHLPTLNVHPLSDEALEYQRAELLEDAMEWEFARMNRFGPKSPHWEIVESAMKYNMVALQTQYLPHEYRGRKDDKRVRAMLASRRFQWVVHHPATVHTRVSDTGLEGVLKCCLMNAQQLIDLFGPDNPGVQQIKAELAEITDKGNGFGEVHTTSRTLLSTWYTYVDYMDWDQRFQAAVQSDALMREFEGFDVIFRDEKHGLDFLPWVVVQGGHPILQPIIESGMWDNYLHSKTIEFSRAIALAASPNLWIKTGDGTLKAVSIDYTNPVQPIVTDFTSEVQPLRPPEMDQNFAKMLGEIEAQIYSSTTSRVLADVGRYANSALGTVQTIVQASLAQLAGSQSTIERAEALAFIQNFLWIEQTGISLATYRSQTSDENTPHMRRGHEIVIKAGKAEEEAPPNIVYFDTEHLYIDVKITPDAMVDRQAKLNEAIQKVANLGASRAIVFDEYQLGNYDLHETKRASEDLALAEVKGQSDLIVGKAAVQIQQAIAQMQAGLQAQMQAQQQQAQQQQGGNLAGMNPENQTEALNRGGQYASMEGVNTNAGGIAPQSAAPMETRTTLRGRADNGVANQ